MFDTKNEALVLINRGIAAKVYKNCIHLQIGGGSRDGFGFTPYSPYCKENSLIMFPPIDRLAKIPPRPFKDRCPEVCHLFIDKAAVTKAAGRKARLGAIERFLGTPFIWFAKLPEKTQVVIIILLIVLSSPRLATSVLEIIKALK